MGRTGKQIDSADITLFEELTEKALLKEDGKEFIVCLLEREKVSGRLAGSSEMLEGYIAERFYNNEVQVIERLEEERSKLLTEIDLYAQNRRAMRTYDPKFPVFPPPSFIDKKK